MTVNDPTGQRSAESALKQTPHRLVGLRIAPDIGLPRLAIIEESVSCQDLHDQIASVHHSLTLLVVLPIAVFPNLESAQEIATQMVNRDGGSFATYWPPQIETIRFEVRRQDTSEAMRALAATT